MRFFIYLHGFASSPESAKAVYLQQAFAGLNVSLTIPDRYFLATKIYQSRS
ncbi:MULTISPECIES: YqiA/YcfP family alpha/beta fold hydrolase [Moorena]|uniref:Esterase n=1 Tax=Moorena producens (strain JHB) TaxID=1454205 RepID=A0A9Q9UWA7_MOOP1|nr:MULTISPECIES: YqiA/YcfP family alpha/beta fold hydrolase [Moorena]WAN69663.1 hypothetical protein BJP36_36840 [Moorena producens JHB]